ncbi:hypothetical protein RDABS01_012032, partial [Bienertia sinuspersici]
MFPFQRSCELSFKLSDEGDKFEQTNNLLEDQILLDNNFSSSVDLINLNNTTTTTSNPPPPPGRGRGRGRGRGQRSLSSSSLAGTSNHNLNPTNNDEDERKVMHREYERQRRQEMANLYNSLRTILPTEYTQGKRSISDHVGEAINYITHMKKNVKELEEKRDELKQSVESNIEIGESSNNNVAGLLTASNSCNNVLIRESVVGLEVEISIANEDEDRFSLSNALQVVFDHGLEVVSYTSTNFNQRLIHILQCQ